MTGSAGLHVTGQAARDGFVLDAAVDVAPGETLGVLGPSASGKSTLLRAIAGPEGGGLRGAS